MIFPHSYQQMLVYIYIYIYIYRSEGFARTGYLIPGRDGEGGGTRLGCPSAALQGGPKWVLEKYSDFYRK